MTNYHQLSLTLSFFRIFSIIYSYKNNCDLRDDCMVITQYVTEFEDASTTNNVREKMMELFISFVKVNKIKICDLYNENDWSHTLINDNDQFQNAMRNIILDMNRHEKQIINVLITQFASELELFTISPIDGKN